jgi:hypothetical protein
LRGLVRVIEIGAKGQALDHYRAPAEADSYANPSVFPAILAAAPGIRWLLAARASDLDLHLLIPSAR